MADTIGGLFISEILADNAGSSAIDTDGDGNTNKADEFIELQNASAQSISLAGYQVWSEKNGLLFTFGSGATLASGETATIVGNYTGTPPAGYYSAGIPENGNFLPDGEGQKFDTIFLVNPDTGEFVTLSYGQPPRAPVQPPGFPGTTQLGAGEAINSSSPNGAAFARDINGNLIETTPTPGQPNLPCFAEGTLITTGSGPRLVETIAPGDLVLTKDAGFQPILAVGRFDPSRFELRPDHDLAPVVFPVGAIGNIRTMRLSAMHRVLLRTGAAELLFAEEEVLVSARHCIGVRQAHMTQCAKPPVYFHLLLADHQIIEAEGCWVESLFLGDLGLRTLDRRDVWRFAPGVVSENISHARTARRVLKSFEARLLPPISLPGRASRSALAA